MNSMIREQPTDTLLYLLRGLRLRLIALETAIKTLRQYPEDYDYAPMKGRMRTIESEIQTIRAELKARSQGMAIRIMARYGSMREPYKDA